MYTGSATNLSMVILATTLVTVWALVAGCRIQATSDDGLIVRIGEPKEPEEDHPLPAETVSDLQVVDHRPVAGSVNQSLVGTVSVRFNQALMPSTVNPDNVRLMLANAPVSVTLSHDPDGHTLTLTPAVALQPRKTYAVQLTHGLMSQEGEAYGGVAWTFDTAGPIGVTTQATIEQCMSATDLAMLVAVNNARSEARQCGAMTKPAAPNLSYRCELDAAAQRHANDMAAIDFVSHTSSDGSTLAMRISDANYAWQSVGENVAAGSPTVAAVMTGWLQSAGHCDNVMNSGYTHFGQGRATSPQSTFGVYWAQNFASPR
ncbi:CAP domain-containing protein [Marinobacter caseinilyticus]|uniref:CAP domain-containing protein n=1 Tax=Marinobacter caseinilyticus TaxID=2692195 RepID=UPI00140B8770|nr:CAP domain-containing protein [Marinobacter caseinilyticus]